MPSRRIPAAHGIEHMIVHTDETGNDTVAVQIEHQGITGNIRRRASETDSIFPLEVTTVWSSRGAAPVPSITRPRVRAITGASTFTKPRTWGERAWATRATEQASIKRMATTRLRMILPSVHRARFYRRKLESVRTNRLRIT